MKSERRHELQHNDLAEWILKAYDQVLPYSKAILGATLFLAVLAIAITLWHNHNLAQAGEAWSALGDPVFSPFYPAEQTIGTMQKAAKDNPGTAAAQWAEVFAADAALTNGANKILTDKKTGTAFLSLAREMYDNALKNTTIPGAKEQALFGKARTLESMIQNKAQLDEALAAYDDLNKSFPHGMFKAIADQRIASLQKAGALKFYEALAQYTPKKVESPASQLGNLGTLPENPPSEPLLVPAPPVRSGTSETALPVPSLTPTLTPSATAPITSGTGKPEAAKTSATIPAPAGASGTPAKSASAAATKEVPKTEPPKPEPKAADTGKKDKG